MSSDKKSSNALVYMGFAVEIEPEKRFVLQRQYLPLGKVGGKPAWLNPTAIPKPSEMTCKLCGNQLAFLLQIYCSSSENPEYSFHRTLYVFVCRRVECSKTNDASNFDVFRCLLPRDNPFFASESSLLPDPSAEEVPDPFFNETTYAKLCAICGCHANKKCAKCVQRWYCCREHQIIDWNLEHRVQCAASDPDKYKTSEPVVADEKAPTMKNPFLFDEYAIEMATEESGIEQVQYEEGDSDSGSDDDEAPDSTGTENMDKLKEYEELAKTSGILAKDLEGLEECARDSAFKNFQRVVAANPEQILRYDLGGEPLLATDQAHRPTSVPSCSICGAERRFEFQLMPHLLTLIDVDSPAQSIDWATVMVFTCARNCPTPNGIYAREYVFKQDFTSDTLSTPFNVTNGNSC